MSSQPYDLIAEAYLKTDSSPIKEFVAKPTFLSLLGDTSGKKVIDIGCGSGYSSRIVRGTGPNKVVGIDISAQQICMAQKMELKKFSGISYYLCDVRNDSFLPFRDFDIATALYLLHYASTREDLYITCKNIFHALRPGGKFILINSNPDYPTLDNPKYGITAKITPPLVEGAIRIVTYLDGGKPFCDFTTYFWKKDTYEEALLAAGFKEIRWHKPIISVEGIQKFGEKFWD